MYLGGEELPVRIQCKHDSTKQFKSAYKEVKMTRLHHLIRFYISFAFVNVTLSGRFKVGFWCRAYFKHDRALTFRDRSRIFEF